MCTVTPLSSPTTSPATCMPGFSLPSFFFFLVSGIFLALYAVCVDCGAEKRALRAAARSARLRAVACARARARFLAAQEREEEQEAAAAAAAAAAEEEEEEECSRF